MGKPIKREFTLWCVIVNSIDEIWAPDLVDMPQFSKWNKRYIYLLMVIDVFSKLLKDYKGGSVTETFDTIVKEGRQSQCLWVDKGREFYNKHLKELLVKNSIKIHSTENE